MPPNPDPVGDYALTRFLAAPDPAFAPEWLDDEGRQLRDRAGAVEVRLKKHLGRGVITARLPIEQALQLGLIRAAAPGLA